jgi:hypothetical protein
LLSSIIKPAGFRHGSSQGNNVAANLYFLNCLFPPDW